MSLELNLRFSDSTHLVVSLDGQSAGSIAFAARITAKDLEEIRWYLETYAAHYTTDVDDAQARRIESKLPQWGKALFEGSSDDPAAQRLFDLFLSATDQDRLLTVSAEDPAILSLPWELLRDPKGVYLSNEGTRISIRRGTAGPAGERHASFPAAKSHLHLLFVTSRPTDASFLDPRSETQVIMDAVEVHAPGRIQIEFLRPATFRKLVERLTDKLLPAVDVVHFDGHGAFDAGGSFGDAVPNTGYLLFERDSGLTQFISAQFWYRQIGDCKVPLVILSACQSAAMSHSQEGDEAGEPLGSVAYGLTALGIPAVLAMTHSLLVETAGQLFGVFYRHLADGWGVGAALDNARHYLMRNPEKHEVQRGPERVRLTVHDWFLPALYQAGPDVPLVDASVAFETDEQSEIAHGALPDRAAGLSSALPALQEAGFSGRQRELWNIERWFATGTRRISITGFGGQGKTYLASEAGRWLRRTGMFERVAFASYASFQGMDASGYAVATLSLALCESLIDSDAAAAALERTPTLVILDNLEDLEPAALEELLGTAKAWSECGHSRVLLTTRAPDFRHGDYLIGGGSAHRSLSLAGLGTADALNYFEALSRLPPAPEVPLPGPDALLELFESVSFHPLSINLLAVQLKTRLVSELGARLESLLEDDADDKNKNLRASLQLSLDKFDVQLRHWLPRLGVFRGGAWETTLLAATGIPPAAWIELREQLRMAALIEVESLESEGLSVPYLRFHPTLAQLLWAQLRLTERDALNAAHRQQYYELADELDLGDRQHPHQMRSIVRREWPNLLHAAQAALEVKEKWAGDMAETVVRFLGILGMYRDAETLAERARQAADAGLESGRN